MTTTESEQALIHTRRLRPPWATGIDITHCGIAARDGDMSLDEATTYIRTECRGSTKRAYATCCVTCIDALRCHYYRNPADTFDERVGVILDYFRAVPARRFPDEIKRRNAEAEAMERLSVLYADEFNQMVDVLLLGGLQLVTDDEMSEAHQ